MAGAADEGGYASDVTYLGDALEHLRLRCRLRLLAREREGLVPRDPVEAVAAPDASPTELEAELSAVGERIAARLEATDPPPALHRLQATFELDAFERDVLLMALAPSVDGTFETLYGRLKGRSWRAPLDVDVALAVLADGFEERMERRAAFGPNGRLVRHNLLLPGRGAAGDGGEDFLRLELRLPGRVVGLLLGHEEEDASLQSFSRVVEPREGFDRVVLPDEERRRLVRLVTHHDAYRRALSDWGLDEAVPYGQGLVLLFSGPPGTGKTLTARALAHHLGRRLLRVDTARLLERAGALESGLDALLREARLQRAVLLFDDCEALFNMARRGSGQLANLFGALEAFEGVTILATNAADTLDPAVDRRILYRVDFEVPPPRQREAIWRLHLPDRLPLAEDPDIPQLARRFEFAGGYIKNAVLLAAGEAAAREAEGEAPRGVTRADLHEAAERQLRHRLERYADRDVLGLGLEDLILPEETRDELRELVDAVAAQRTVLRDWGFDRRLTRGRGLAALFDGEPGTGKTLAAEVVASELGLGLYRVNAANVVSKYIGETEKNLTRVFAEARSARAVLLFDEADSLFSRRVEVQQANDRFANMEVNTLLQLVERHDGLVILTTNLQTALDHALERRLSFRIDFPFPEADVRTRIWRHLIPEEAPLAEDVDFDVLGACFELAGGSIKNAVLRAAYRAAAAGESIDLRHLDAAAKQECQAAGKLYRSAVPVDDDEL